MKQSEAKANAREAYEGKQVLIAERLAEIRKLARGRRSENPER